MYYVFLFAILREDERASQPSTLKFGSSILARSDLIASAERVSISSED